MKTVTDAFAPVAKNWPQKKWVKNRNALEMEIGATAVILVTERILLQPRHHQ